MSSDESNEKQSPKGPPKSIRAQLQNSLQKFQYQQDPENEIDQQKQIDYFDDEEIHSLNHQNNTHTNDNMYDLKKNLEFNVDSEYTRIYLKKNEPQTIKAKITLQINDPYISNKAKGFQKSGLDLICVIDRSGSMSGDKIKIVKKTLYNLLNQQTEKDRLCLVQFNHQAERLTPLLKASSQNIIKFKKVIDSIESFGGTKISEGTGIAFEQFKKRKYRNQVTSIFLLSDGEDPSAEEEVKEQLQQFDEPFSIYSFAYGSDYDLKLINSLCSLKSGSFYLVHKQSLLDEFFSDALGELVSVVGENIEIFIKLVAEAPFDGIRISKTYGNMWEKLDDLNYKIKIPQLSVGKRKDFVFELTFPKYDRQMERLPKVLSVIDAALALKSIYGQIVKRQTTLKIEFFGIKNLIQEKQEKQENPVKIEVLVQFHRVKASETIDSARVACEEQKYDTAQVLLKKDITDINKNQNIAKASQGILRNLDQATQAALPENFKKFGQQQMYQMVSNNYVQAGINANFNEKGEQIQQGIQGQYQNQVQVTLVHKVQVVKNMNFTETQLLSGHTDFIQGIDICEQRNLLVTGSSDKMVILWNLQQYTLIKTYQSSGRVYDVVFSNNGNLLAFGGGGIDFLVYLIDISNFGGDITYLFGHKSYIFRIKFLNNLKYLISGSSDKTVRIWDIKLEQEDFFLNFKSIVYGVAISSDDAFLAFNQSNGQIQIWNFKNKILMCSNTTDEEGCGIQFSNDQKMLVSSHCHGSIILWSCDEIKDGKLILIRKLQVANSCIWTVLFSSCSNFIISISNQDSQIKVIDSQTDEEVKLIQFKQTNDLRRVSVVISKNMDIMAYGQDNQVVVQRIK